MSVEQILAQKKLEGARRVDSARLALKGLRPSDLTSILCEGIDMLDGTDLVAVVEHAVKRLTGEEPAAAGETSAPAHPVAETETKAKESGSAPDGGGDAAVDDGGESVPIQWSALQAAKLSCRSCILVALKLRPKRTTGEIKKIVEVLNPEAVTGNNMGSDVKRTKEQGLIRVAGIRHVGKVSEWPEYDLTDKGHAAVDAILRAVRHGKEQLAMQ